MSIGAITANPLLSLQMRPDAPQTSPSIWSEVAQRRENSAQPPLAILPMGATVTLSFETILSLQSEEMPAPVSLERSVEDAFLEEARKSPVERMREQALKELGLSEEDLAKLPPEEKRAVEDKIRDMIEEKLRQGMGADGEPPESVGAIIQSVA